ncbi:MAG: hypothetical protein WBZ30_04345, partial [Bradyrhizobium sp.]
PPSKREMLQPPAVMPIRTMATTALAGLIGDRPKRPHALYKAMPGSNAHLAAGGRNFGLQ